MIALTDAQLDEVARVAIYDHFIHIGSAPDPAALAARIGVTHAALAASYTRLAQQQALVLGVNDEIAMAIPFAANPTDVQVTGKGVTWWANCAFDGLGIPALLGCDAVIETACPQSATPITVTVRDRVPHSSACVLHMAVPLASWWDNIDDT